MTPRQLAQAAFPTSTGALCLGCPGRVPPAGGAQAQVLTAGASHNGGRVHCDMQLVAEGHPLHTGRPDGRGAWPDAAGRMPVGGRSANQRSGAAAQAPSTQAKEEGWAARRPARGVPGREQEAGRGAAGPGAHTVGGAHCDRVVAPAQELARRKVKPRLQTGRQRGHRGRLSSRNQRVGAKGGAWARACGTSQRAGARRLYLASGGVAFSSCFNGAQWYGGGDAYRDTPHGIRSDACRVVCVCVCVRSTAARLG